MLKQKLTFIGILILVLIVGGVIIVLFSEKGQEQRAFTQLEIPQLPQPTTKERVVSEEPMEQPTSSLPEVLGPEQTEQPIEQKPTQLEQISGQLPLFKKTPPKDWQNAEEPNPSKPLQESEYPDDAIVLELSANGFNPPSFEVKTGQKVTLIVKDTDQWVHVFKFKDPSLENVSIGLSSGQARGIMFYAPEEKGEYGYFCSVPGHEVRGEQGKMIVK